MHGYEALCSKITIKSVKNNLSIITLARVSVCSYEEQLIVVTCKKWGRNVSWFYEDHECFAA